MFACLPTNPPNYSTFYDRWVFGVNLGFLIHIGTSPPLKVALDPASSDYFAVLSGVLIAQNIKLTIAVLYAIGKPTLEHSHKGTLYYSGSFFIVSCKLQTPPGAETYKLGLGIGDGDLARGCQRINNEWTPYARGGDLPKFIKQEKSIKSTDCAKLENKDTLEIEFKLTQELTQTTIRCLAEGATSNSSSDILRWKEMGKLRSKCTTYSDSY